MNDSSLFHAGLLVFGERGNITQLDKGLAGLFGYEKDELIGQPLSMLFPSLETQAQDLSSQREAIIRLEGVTKNGESLPTSLTLSSLGTHTTERTAIIQDLSDLQSSKARYSETENKLNAIINTEVDGIISIDKQGTVKLVI
ncbi:MAG: PAS domain S-box protein, partial [Bacteroidota bacterium]